MKEWFLKISLMVILFLTLFFSRLFSDVAMATRVQEIVTNKDAYQGREVSVKGTVLNIKIQMSTAKHPFMTFKLIGESGSLINVFIWGRLKLQIGQKVEVRGIYQKILRVGQRIYYNQIEASEIKLWKDNEWYSHEESFAGTY